MGRVPSRVPSASDGENRSHRRWDESIEDAHLSLATFLMSLSSKINEFWVAIRQHGRVVKALDLKSNSFGIVSSNLTAVVYLCFIIDVPGDGVM